jgi:hypothetical protein
MRLDVISSAVRTFVTAAAHAGSPAAPAVETPRSKQTRAEAPRSTLTSEGRQSGGSAPATLSLDPPIDLPLINAADS